MNRRSFVVLGGAALLASVAPEGFPLKAGERGTMYGLIGKITAVPGRRDDLIAILLAGVNEMPGCLSYIVAKDASDASAIWITEVWDSESSHQASLSLPSVKEAISRGKPLIAQFVQRVVTEPVGGHGLAPTTAR
jgi:quinol monooxygenase YgiN